MIVIDNCEIITGDGHTRYPLGYVVISDGQIKEIGQGRFDGALDEMGTLIDGQGATAFPGLINAHAHGCRSGPLMPSGSPPMSLSEITYQKTRHLLGGTTTLVNVCGLSLPSDQPERDSHPIDVHWTTAHTDACLAAALAVDGRGLSPLHRKTTIEAAIEAGAVGLGEGGGGQTLGGGAQDYLFIPRAILKATGVKIDAQAARALKVMVLGRDLKGKGAASWLEFVNVCATLGLTRKHNPRFVADVIATQVMSSVEKGLEGLGELGHWSSRTGLPALVHTAAPSAQTIISLARANKKARLIAAHCNHPSFTPQEAVEVATRLKELGVTIEACTLDTITTQWRNMAQNLDALVDAGLVDILSTDYAGGHWDGILEAVHRMKILDQMDISKAIALATGNVARCFPAFADRGTLTVGKRGDIVIADTKNLARVRHVLVGGKLVVRDGTITE